MNNIDRSQIMKMTSNGLEQIQWKDVKKGQHLIIFNFRNEKIVEIKKMRARSDCVDGKVRSDIRGVRLGHENDEEILPFDFNIDCTKI